MIIMIISIMLLVDEPLVEGDRALLQAMRDAQRSLEGRYPRGELSGSTEMGIVGEKDPQLRVEGRLVWNGPKFRFQGTIRNYKPPPGADAAQFDPVVSIDMIRDEKTMSTYWMKARNVRVVLSAKEGAFPHTDLRPDVNWFGRNEVGRPWVQLLGPHPDMPQDAVKQYSVNRLDADKIELLREDANGSRLRWIASQESDGQIVEHEARAAASSERFKVRCQWARDSKARVYLLQSDLERTYDDPKSKHPVNLYRTYKTTSFNPDFRPPDSLFNQSDLTRIEGTRVDDEVAKRTYRVGKEPREQTETGLNGLADEVRARGFAGPDRR
jgi:hypothetical protein